MGGGGGEEMGGGGGGENTQVKVTTSLLCFNLFTGSHSPQRGQCKINTSAINVLRALPPFSLCDCLQLYTLSRILRSASDTLSLQIPRARLSSVGSRAFSVFSPSTWNHLPLPLRQKRSLTLSNQTSRHLLS